MQIYDFIFNSSTAGCLLNLFVHIILLSTICWLLVIASRKYSMKLRESLTATTILSVVTVSILSVVFILSNYSWVNISMLDAPHENTANIEAVVGNIDVKSSSLPKEKISMNKNIAVEPVIAESAPSFSWELKHYYGVVNILGLLWLAGFVVCMFRLSHGLLYVRKLKRVMRNPHFVASDNIRNSFSQVFKTKKFPEIRTSSMISSPIVIGFTKPFIVIPARLYENISENELKSIIFHEYGHIHRRDNFTGLNHRLLLAFYWWNPAVKWICNHYSMICENICDEYAVKGLGSAHLYSNCLLQLVKLTNFNDKKTVAVCMASNSIELKQRIKNVLSKENEMKTRNEGFSKFAGIITMITISVFIAGCGIFVTKTKEPAKISKEKSSDKVEALINKLKDKNPKVRRQAVYTLSNLNDERAIEPFAKLLKDEDSSVRVHAAASLALLGDKRAVPVAIALLKNKNKYTRQQAVSALHVLKDKRAIKPLQELLKTEKDQKEINAIKRALKKLNGKALFPQSFKANKFSYMGEKVDSFR